MCCLSNLQGKAVRLPEVESVLAVLLYFHIERAQVGGHFI